MQPIHQVRTGLQRIPGALLEIPPGWEHPGPEPGVRVDPIWSPIQNGDEWSGPEEEGEDDPARAELHPHFEIGPEVEQAIAMLKGQAGEPIRRSVLLAGTDALAYYSSFHVLGAQWGIYIPVSGLIYVMAVVFDRLPLPIERKAALAFKLLQHHELFHFATDYAIGQAELAHQEPWWALAKPVHRMGNPAYLQLEEQLANAHMLRMARSRKPALTAAGKRAALKEFCRKQPPGYRDAVQVRPEDWPARLADLAFAYGKHSVRGRANDLLWDARQGFDWAAQFQVHPTIDWRHCPIHLVRDGDRFGIPPFLLDLFSRLETIRESDKFLKQLARLGPAVQKAWKRVRAMVQQALTPGLDFKPWPKAGPDIFSLRVNDRVRAHLQFDRARSLWEAFEIGGHKEMGHG